MKKRGQALFILISLLLLVVALLFWYLYQNLPGSSEPLEAIFTQPKLKTGNLSYKVAQFSPNMKFNHNSISYSIDTSCETEKRERMIEAFGELAKRVGFINFYLTNTNPDIEVSCSEEVEKLAKERTKKGFFVAGEGGAEEIVLTGRYNVVTDGIILLYSFPHKAIECGWPNIELHELLHVFGFGHSGDRNSLMYPILESCEQKLDESIIQDLRELYSQENLADLYFGELSAIKKGRYLDFNITVKNAGVISAENVVLTVLDNEEKIEDFKLGEIPFGGGITFQVANLKLRSRSSEDIELVIDISDSIKELDEENNIARLVFR